MRHWVSETTPVLFSERHGCGYQGSRCGDSFIFLDDAHETLLYIRIASAPLVNTKEHLPASESCVSSAWAILFFAGEHPPCIYPGRSAQTLDLLIENIFTQTSFPVHTGVCAERGGGRILHSDEMFHKEVSGVFCTILDGWCYIFEPSTSPHIVAASVYGPSHEAKKREYRAYSSMSAEHPLQKPLTVIRAMSLQEVEIKVLFWSFPGRVLLHAGWQWFKRTVLKGGHMAIALFQTVTAIMLWLNGVQLRWDTRALIVLWVVSLLIAVDGSRCLRLPLFSPFPAEIATVRHQLRCLVFVLLGGGILAYEIGVLHAFPHDPSSWSSHEIVSAVWAAVPFVLPPLVVSEIACIVEYLSS